MRVISNRKLVDFWDKHATAQPALEAWYRRALNTDWSNYHDLSADYPAADIVGDCVVFNIHGNHFRLIARLRFPTHILYGLQILTHAQYDKQAWVEQCGC